MNLGNKIKDGYLNYLKNIKSDDAFYVHGKIVKFSSLSLGILDNKSKFRIILVWIITSKWFDHFIVFVIMLNSVILGIKDYKDIENKTPINNFIETYMEPLFTYVFMAECIIKVLAMGFILDRRSYLGDSWNQLDFVVVVTSMLD